MVPDDAVCICGQPAERIEIPYVVSVDHMHRQPIPFQATKGAGGDHIPAMQNGLGASRLGPDNCRLQQDPVIMTVGKDTDLHWKCPLYEGVFGAAFAFSASQPLLELGDSPRVRPLQRSSERWFFRCILVHPDAREDLLLRLVDTTPAIDAYPLALVEVLVVLEEMGDLLQNPLVKFRKPS